MTTHAIGNNGKSSLPLELVGAGRFPIGVSVFVVWAQTAYIAQTCQFDTRPNPHETSRNLET
jgi:hypothetical protein